MNDIVVELDMRSYADCRKRIKSFDKVVQSAAMRGIKSSAVNVLGDSQRNIKAHDSIATAQLINSGKTKPNMSGRYVDVIYNVIQAFFVEFGRKAGKIPPYEHILQWVHKRGIAATYTKSGRKRSSGARYAYTSLKTRKTHKVSNYWKQATSAAIAIAKSIGKRGTPAKPFLHPALRSNETKTLSLIKQEIDKTIQSYGK